ncbi:hypothetical protein AB8Q18_08830 [Neisseriaceae bacterium CLB008]
MMSYHDERLGELSFFYGWTKALGLNINSKKYVIQCVFDAYSENEVVTDEQKKSYQLFMEKQEYFEGLIFENLTKYMHSGGVPTGTATPKTLLFKRNGDFGLLLDCDWDIENGVVIVIYPEVKVGIQDIFL